jgi:hypothetical protein
MLVGNNESATTKNAGESLVISIAMQMRRCDVGRIARWSTSWASLEAIKRHRTSAHIASPQRPPVYESGQKHKTLTNNYF